MRRSAYRCGSPTPLPRPSRPTPEERERLKAFLAENDLYLYTVNAFPYGPFKGVRVKEQVYEPDWRSEERTRYTMNVADVLAEIGAPGHGAVDPDRAARLQAERDGTRCRRVVRGARASRGGPSRRSGAADRHDRDARDRARAVLLPRDDRRDRRLLRRASLFRRSRPPGSPSWQACRCPTRTWRSAATSASCSTSATRPSSTRTCPASLGSSSTAGDSDPEAAGSRRPADPRRHRRDRRGPAPLRRDGLPDADARDAETARSPAISTSRTRSRPGRRATRSPREWRVHIHVPVFLDDLGAFRSTRFAIAEALAHPQGDARSRPSSRSRPTHGTCSRTS